MVAHAHPYFRVKWILAFVKPFTIIMCWLVVSRRKVPPHNVAWLKLSEGQAVYFLMHVATAVFPLWRWGALRASVISLVSVLLFTISSALCYNAREVARFVVLDAVFSVGHYALHTALGITAVPRLFGSFWAWLAVNQVIGIPRVV